MYQVKHKIKSVRNTIIQLENGERIDLRKAQIASIRHQKRGNGNKYGARSAEYSGTVYHSTAEARFAQQLDLRVKGKEILKWEKQIRCPLIVNGFKICTYIPDFRLTYPDGTIEWVEIKGMMTAAAAIKIKLFEALYVNDAKGVRFTLIKV